MATSAGGNVMADMQWKGIWKLKCPVKQFGFAEESGKERDAVRHKMCDVRSA